MTLNLSRFGDIFSDKRHWYGKYFIQFNFQDLSNIFMVFTALLLFMRGMALMAENNFYYFHFAIVDPWVFSYRVWIMPWWQEEMLCHWVHRPLPKFTRYLIGLKNRIRVYCFLLTRQMLSYASKIFFSFFFIFWRLTFSLPVIILSSFLIHYFFIHMMLIRIWNLNYFSWSYHCL